MLSIKSECPQRFKPLVDSHFTVTDCQGWTWIFCLSLLTLDDCVVALISITYVFGFMLKPFINCRAEARRSLSVGSSAATLYCGNRTCGKSDSGSWATCDNLQQPSSFQLEDKRLTHIDGVWASFKHSDLLALKSLEPLRNLRVSFAGGAYSAFSFSAYIPCHEVKPLCINKFIAIPLRSSPWIDLSYLASCRWAFKSWSCARKTFWIFGLPKLIDLSSHRRDRLVFFPWEVTIINMTKKMPDTSANFWNGHGVPC